MNLDRCLLFSWIEEDNIQKAYFRVRPLLTIEGDVRSEAEELWPGEGCLRIVPDRYELHSFKGRMRSLGSWCVVDLRGLPTDAGKIRTNKNFSPAKGEVNQYILYSDTVKPMPAHSFYQIVDGEAANYASAAQQAITPRFFIREGDTLYGPVDAAAPAQPETAKEAAGMLFELPCPDGVTRMILCMDDAPAPVLRQPVARVNPARAAEEKPTEPTPAAGEKPAEAVPAAAEKPAEAVPAAEEKPAETAPADGEKPAETAPADGEKPAETTPADGEKPAEAEPATEEKPAETAPAVEKPAETTPAEEKPAADALPIAERLHILDASKGHEQTVQELNKPVSRGANLLNQRENRPLRPQPLPNAKPGQLGGTQLVQTPLRTSTPQPKNRLQELASRPVVGDYEPPAHNLPRGIRMHDVQNPVELACSTLRQAWHATDSHQQLLDCILSLDGFRAKLETRLCKSSGTTLLQKVLRDRLQDLEAERLGALCELDRARRDTDAYRQELLEAMKARLTREAGQLQQTRDDAQRQLDSVKAELNGLTQQRDALQSLVAQLQQDTLPAESARLLAQAQMLSPSMGTPLRMSPAAGTLVGAEEMIGKLMDVCAASGVVITRNHAVALLALLAISPRIGVVCPTVAPMATLARNIAAAFGWSQSFAHQYSPEQRPMVAARPVDSAPALLMTGLQNYAPISGVSKVLTNRNVPGMIRNAAYDADPWPVLVLPALPYVEEKEAAPDTVCVSAASLAALLNAPAIDAQQLHTALDPVLRAAAPLSGAARRNMFRFISVCAPLMEGGFASAADWAVLLWIVPAVDRAGRHYAAVKAVLDEYPLSQAAL